MVCVEEEVEAHAAGWAVSICREGYVVWLTFPALFEGKGTKNDTLSKHRQQLPIYYS